MNGKMTYDQVCDMLNAQVRANVSLADENRKLLEGVRELLASLRREHVQIEDGWFSCPKCDQGSLNPGEGDECNCGADAHNAKIDAFLAGLAQ